MPETPDRDTEKVVLFFISAEGQGLYPYCSKKEILDFLYVKRKLMAELKVCSLCRHCYRK
jgi:hypothetical protein